MTTVMKTTDYEIFKVHEYNRPYNQPHIERLSQSLDKNNLMHLQPVLCTTDMTVLDGHHRIEAAKLAEVPVYYMVTEDSDVDVLRVLNNNKLNWTPSDFQQYYLKLGHPEYRKLQQFCDENKLTLQCGLMWTGATARDCRQQFRDGKYLFIVTPQKLRCLEMAKFIIDQLKDTSFAYSRMFDQTSFHHACADFFSHSKIDHERFKERWAQWDYRFDIERTSEAYISQLVSIYNYNMKSQRVRYVKDGLKWELL